MTEEARRLIKAFETKEESEGFISNLEQLKLAGSVTPEVYSSLAAEYQQKLEASSSEIERMKSDFKNLLAQNLRQKDSLIDDLATLEYKYKAGEIVEEYYQKSRDNLEGKIENLNQHRNQLNKLIDSKSSRDVYTETEKSRAAPAEIQSSEPGISAGKRSRSSRKRAWIVIGAVAVLIVAVCMAVLFIPGEENQVKQVTIPIDIVGAENIGSLHFELTYDAALLEVVSVKPGTITSNALFESSSSVAGQIIVGMVSSNGVSGDGSVAEVTFKIKTDNKGSIPIVLDNISVYDVSDLSGIPVSWVAGNYVVKDGSFTSPTMYFTAQ